MRKPKQNKETKKYVSDEWQRTFDAITDIVFIQDKDSNIVRANKVFFKAIKLEPKDVIGKKCYDVLHKSDKPWPTCPFERTKADNSPHTEEVFDPNIGVPLLITTSPILDDNGNLIGSVHIAKDITNIKKTEKDLEDSREELKAHVWGLEKTNEAIRNLYRELELKNMELRKLDSLKSDFVSTVSHELRTPLSIIKEGISLVLDGITGEVNDKQKRYLGLSRQNVDRLEGIINDLLNISKIEAGKIELKKKPTYINELIEHVGASFEAKLKAKGLELKMNLPGKDVSVYVDPDKITQVFVNLIGNSLKFTHKGHIELSFKEKKQEIECTVADTGVGIAKNDLPKAFEKFRQFEREDGPGEKGTGLGLSISKGIVELHNGNIWIESEYKKGTSFIFTLPKHTAETVLREHLNRRMEEALRSDTKMSLVYIKVSTGGDKKKGSKEPDILNKRIEEFLRKDLKQKADIVFKSAEEFTVIVSSCDKTAVVEIKKKIQKMIEDYYVKNAPDIKARLLLGSATYPDDARNDKDLIRKAKG